MKLLLLLLSGFIINNCTAADNAIARDTSFLDSSDLRILLSSKSVILYELEGEPVEDSMKKSNQKYINNYLIKSRKVLTKDKALDLKIALLDDHNVSSETTRCTFLADRCIKFIYGKQELVLFLSRSGTCGQLLKIIKTNSHTKRQAIQNYIESSFNIREW